MSHYLVPFSVLEQVIQGGQCADSPEVLYHYLNLTEEYAERLSINDAILLHQRVFNVLLDTVCDTSLAPHWRQTCLDKVYLPLLRLKQLIVTYQDAREYFKMEHNLRILSHYFVSSFEHKDDKNS
ncbi:hypothetical protein [Marinomonas algarum]|uniref:Uncharacterized protein n=1 Tax=Marinomonas algarum TaxID=2883105 RepID=A0A9X1LEI3_9GAMM|nr:hypothetical protein [Marinomonas algarum]MCB5161488.1 hypothetical protein [Marinomonas algarum]